MIYLDSSVVLSELFAEDRELPEHFEQELWLSSRLLEYEVWNRIHVRGLSHSHSAETHALLDRIELIDLDPSVLARALKPFPVSVRTLDALHLATLEYIRDLGHDIELASYDGRLVTAARELGIPIYEL